MKAPSFWYFSPYHVASISLKFPSSILGTILILRRTFCKKKIIDFPSVGVGSLALGGAGKTTLSLKICQMIRDKGKRPVFVHKGFGGKKEGVFFPTDDIINDDISDEIILALKRGFVSVSLKNRENSPELIKNLADVIVFDDFFSRMIEPDVKVLVFTKESVGNMLVFPFGPLREPISSLLWADIILFEKGINPKPLKKANTRKTFFFSSTVKNVLFSDERGKIEIKSPKELVGAKAILVSAIALPSRFSKTVRNLGVNIVEGYFLPDHSKIPSQVIYDIKRKISKNLADIVITTEKDFWKLVGKLPVWALQVDFEIENEEKFKKDLCCALCL